MMIMALLKMARQMNADKRDNIVDAIGYIGLINRINHNNLKDIEVTHHDEH